MPKAGAPGATELQVTRLGAGPPVLLIHGSVVGPMRTWRHQLELGESWNLILPYRPGFGESPPLPRGDFESEAPLMAELLGEGAHLVGHSYGAVVALYAAALRPDRVRSLILVDPVAGASAATMHPYDYPVVGEYLWQTTQMPTMADGQRWPILRPR